MGMQETTATSPLRAFRQSAYACLGRRKDSLFDLQDAVLASSGDEIQRMQATIALASFADPAAAKVLIAALDDEDRLVRHHAARALLALHGVVTANVDSEHMMYRVMASDKARHESGKRDVLDAIKGKKIKAPE